MFSGFRTCVVVPFPGALPGEDILIISFALTIILFQTPAQGYQDEPQPGEKKSIFDKFHNTVHQMRSEIKNEIKGQFVIAEDKVHAHTHVDGQCFHGAHDSENRFDSFAAPRENNDIKWFVDGCGYMWAVSKALENARESIWILDCELPSSMFDEFRKPKSLCLLLW